MKNLLLTFACLTFLFVNLNAQKVKVKDLDVRAKYCKLPSIGLPTSITSYHVETSLDENALANLGYTVTNVKNSFQIEGYNKSDEAVGAKVLYEIIDGPGGTPLKLNTNSGKTKDGKAWTNYSYSITVSAKSRVKVIDETGKVLGEDVQLYSKGKTSNSYKTVKELKKNINTEKFYKSGRSVALSSILNNASSFVKTKFGLRAVDEKVEFKRLSSKKHPEYKKYLRIEDDVKNAFAKMTIHSNDEFAEMIQPSIDFWIEKEPKYSAKDKHQKKLKYLCQYNTALAYFHLEDLENATLWATKVQSGDYKEKHGKKLLKKITELQAKFDKLNRNTRHIKIEESAADIEKREAKIAERSAAIESGDIQAFPDFNPKLNVSNNSIIVKGEVHHTGGSVNEGYFVYENTYLGRPDFRKPKQLRFGYLQDGKIATGTMKYAGIKHMIIDGQRYDVQDVALGSGFTKLKLKNAIIEEAQEYDRTTLLLVFPPFLRAKGLYGSSDTDLEAELVVFNKETEKIHTTKGMLGANKALKKIIKGCKAAEDHLEATKKSRKKKSILKRLSGFDNSALIQELLKKYDTCK